MAAVDVFFAVSDIGAQAFSVTLVGIAVLTIFVAIAAFKYVKAALGYVPSGAMLDPIPPPPWADDSPIMTAEDFDAMYNPHFEAPSDAGVNTAEEFDAMYNPHFEAPSDAGVNTAEEFDAMYNPIHAQLEADYRADELHDAQYGTGAESEKMERDVLDYQLHLDDQADALHNAHYGMDAESAKMERDVDFYKNL